MKKLLTLVLVLGLTSMAYAIPTGWQISVGGNPEPEDSTIILEPSDIIILDIYSTLPITPGSGEGYWALVASEACATISGGYAVPEHADYFIEIYDDAKGAGGMPIPDGPQGPENGVWGQTFTFGAEIPPGILYDGIEFHCETDNGPTVVTLYQITDNWELGEILDQVVIHQIPEPTTMALLGLGGLLLLRRRK
jgi:hypothetical protein